MKLKFFSILAFLFANLLVNGQIQQRLIVNSDIKLLKDSIESQLLISNLNDFLIASQQENMDNKWVLESQKLETFIELDELKDIEKAEQFKDDFFYKPYLSNVLILNKNQYLIKVSYLGLAANSPYFKANFEFIAHKIDNSYQFSSPLVLNTKHWKTKKVRNNIFHYQNTINQSKVKEFNKLTAEFDKKLKAENSLTIFYCCENLDKMLKLIGVEYKLDYNGETESVFSASSGNKKIFALGNNNSSFDNFDPHDLWHDRLSLVIARKLVNKPVDEGCAYLYGGSWGISWKDIFKEFMTQIAINKQINWVDLKENPVYFKTNGYSNPADYIVNALIVKKIEKEKGFEGVWELLNCGKFEKGNEKYYKILEKLTGITKANYNEKVWELINNEN